MAVLDAAAMMRSLVLPASVSLSILAMLVACAADDVSPVASDAPDAATSSPRDGGGTTTPGPDATVADAEAPLASQAEVEPNDGKTETETNPMTVPGEMTGTIDLADDRDIFRVTVSKGELWQWTITPAAAMAPHLAVFDLLPDNQNPSRVVFADPGAPAVLDHFVLSDGAFVAGVRDARNVPTATGKGGPTFGYTLRAVKRPLAPAPVTFPSTKTGKLASPGALDFYSFSATKGTVFGIVLRAARKVPASTLDSRLSLFDLTAKKSIITNDNAGGSPDSQIGGQIPETSDYLVVVENEGTNPTDLSYELVFQTTEP